MDAEVQDSITQAFENLVSMNSAALSNYSTIMFNAQEKTSLGNGISHPLMYEEKDEQRAVPCGAFGKIGKQHLASKSGDNLSINT